MHKVKSIEVYYKDRLVGTMALYRGMLAAFEYSYEWLKDGFSISPFSLPLEQKVFIPRIDPCDGLFGVFSDSLPDGWGRLLVDRLMKKKRDPYEIGISAVRGGNIVGEHEVIFAGQDEVIEFKHTAYSKAVFAKGAVEAAKFLHGKGAGHYDMADVIAAK